jgi:glycosyltransferase involved in cell wall biosynthesis
MNRTPPSHPVILFDATLLGEGAATPRHQRGLYRVVQELAWRLAARPDLSLRFHTNRDNGTAVLHAIRTDRRLRQVPVVGIPARCRWLAFTIPWQAALDVFVTWLQSKPKSAGWRFTIARPLRKPAILILNGLVWLTRTPPTTDHGNADASFFPYLERPDWPGNDLGRFPLAVIIHDLIPFRFPINHSPADTARFVQTLQAIPATAQVLCVSEFTRRDWLDFRPEFPPANVQVIPLAATAAFQPEANPARLAAAKQRIGLPANARYIFSLCYLEPRKNLIGLIQAFGKLLKRHPDTQDLFLVLAGGKGWHYRELLDEQRRDPILQDRVLFPGLLPDDILPALYAGATVSACVSFYEGFGLPVLESMQCGCPVVIANRTSLPEVAGDAGILVDPGNADEIAAALESVLNDPELRRALSERSRERARHFSWDACADRIAVILKSLADGQTGNPVQHS